MERFHQLRLTAKRTADWVLDQVIRFARDTDGWRTHKGIFPGEGIAGNYCVIVFADRKPAACLGFVADHRSPRAVRLTNVFPGQTGGMPLNECNRIAERFARDFRAYARRKRIPITLKLSAFRLSLKTAIPSKRCRKLFENYIAHYPLSYHPSDIRNLDKFICGLHRYHAKADVDAIAAYLIQHRKWPTEDARSVRSRILFGLDILDVYTRG